MVITGQAFNHIVVTKRGGKWSKGLIFSSKVAIIVDIVVGGNAQNIIFPNTKPLSSIIYYERKITQVVTPLPLIQQIATPNKPSVPSESGVSGVTKHVFQEHKTKLVEVRGGRIVIASSRQALKKRILHIPIVTIYHISDRAIMFNQFCPR